MYRGVTAIGVSVSLLLCIITAHPIARLTPPPSEDNPVIQTTDTAKNSSQLIQSGCGLYKTRTSEKTVKLLQCKNAGLEAMPTLDPDLNIDVVDLSGNNISNVHLSAGYNQVKKINLEQNLIRTITEETLEEFKLVHKLYIGKNPFHCDCKLEWLRTRLLGSSNHSPFIAQAHEIKCASPVILHERALETLTKEQLCGSESDNKLSTTEESDEKPTLAKRNSTAKKMLNSTVLKENEVHQSEKGRVVEIVGVTMAFVGVIVVMSVLFIIM